MRGQKIGAAITLENGKEQFALMFDEVGKDPEIQWIIMKLFRVFKPVPAKTYHRLYLVRKLINCSNLNDLKKH